MSGLNFDGLNTHLLRRGVELLREWFPAGKQVGREFKVGSINGEPGASLGINIDTGLWADFGAGDTGKDLPALYARVHRLDMGAAYHKLCSVYGYTNGSAGPLLIAQPEETEEELPPLPDYAPTDDLQFIHPKHGHPSKVHWYRNRDGDKTFAQARYESLRNGQSSKEFCPWTWREDAWRMQAPPRPRPLYGLERLNMPLTKSCLIVEGEKCADALKAVLNQPIFSPFGGVAGFKHADWSVLRGRSCLLWPDNDDGGIGAMQWLANHLMTLGCKVDMVVTESQPAKWDAADALMQEQWTLEELKKWLQAHRRPISEARSRTVTATITDRHTPPLPTGPVDIDRLDPEALWREAGLTISKLGPFTNEHNMGRILDFAERIDSRIEVWFDTFLNRVLYRDGNGCQQEWTDEMDTRIAAWVQFKFHIPRMGIDVVRRAVLEYARRRSRNCVREWLESLVWDGVERLPDMMRLAFGAIASEYASAVGRCFMVGMVARAMAPGCKVDHMPVFEGGQGIGKSTALKIIGGEWFSEVHDSILSKDWVLSIQGKLLTEVSELHSFRRSEMSAIKGRISDASDRFRPPYGRYAINCPRQGVMAGTTNEDDWNEDETGEARRFWPIRCHTIDLEWLRQNRLQLFAEALARYRRSELWHDVPAEEARRQQAARRSDDPWGTRIEVWLAQRGDTPVLIPDVLEHCLAMKPEHWSKINTRRIGGVLRDLGYVRRSVRDGSAVYKAFVKRYAGEVLSKIGDDEPF